jgi:hypothetical protein
MLDTRLTQRHNEPMTEQTPAAETPTDADLERVDAAEAPPIAELLADRLEVDLEAVSDRPGGEG